MITEGIQQVLTTLYPLYKQEVFQRREQMMKLTAFGSLGLIGMLLALLLSPTNDQLTSFQSLLIAFAAIVWFGLSCALILQQQYRHRLAKQVLIQIERALGFYEEGLFVEHQTLYPDNWKTAWLGDKSGALYFSCLSILTGLILLALVLI